MPSKSKAQARFFAAAAHNPDFAKKAGISTKAAKEWNHADEKEGTLKKGSKKPEHVKEEVLDEASGVGNFPVPPSSLKLVQKYASSIVLTYAYKSFQEMQKNFNQESQKSRQNVLPYLKRFQQKYGAQVLNDASMKRYVNQSINIPFDHIAIFRELPKSLQHDAVKILIEKMRIFVTFDAKYNKNAGGHARRINESTSEIVISLRPENFQFLVDGENGINSTVERMDYFMGSIEHEMQHAFQEIVTSQVSSKKDKNLEMKKDYEQMGDAYHASGVEFGPQTKDMISAGALWLDAQNDNNALSGDVNLDVKNAIQYAFKRLEGGQGKVYQALKNYNEDANAKKHMILIYKGLVKHYHDMENVVDSELDLEQKDVDGGENRMYHSTTLGPDDDFESDDTMVQIYRAMKKIRLQPYQIEEDRTGVRADYSENPYNRIANMKYILRDGGAVHFVKHGDTVRMYAFKNRNNPSKKDPDGYIEYDIDVSAANKISEEPTSLRTFSGIKHLLESLKHQDDQTELDKLATAFPKLFEEAKQFSGVSDPSKKLSYDLDEGTLYFRFAGSDGSWYIQDTHDNSYVLEDNISGARKGYIKYSAVEDIITQIFAIYQMLNEQQFNIFMEHIKTLNITVESVEEAFEYSLESSQKPVEESSMRSMMDLVQDAEIADGIDMAQKSTDVARAAQKKKDDHINGLNQLGEEEHLDEMPQRFDAFADQDRDEFVDKSAEMAGKHNMEPFAQHDQFDVMRIKNGSGFIAYNKQGQQIALLSGYVSSNEVQGVPNVFVENAVAAKSAVKGVVYQMYMDIINAGFSILSDGLHSDDAIKFWTRLLTNHTVYIVGGGEVLARATPEKVHKYWSEDEASPSAELRLLLVK